MRGDHELNAVKAQKLAGVASPLRMASAAEVQAATGSEPGYLGPVGLKGVRVYADHAALAVADFVCGANEKDLHLTGRELGPRPARAPRRADLRNVVAGDPSPSGAGVLQHRARHRGRPHLSARAASTAAAMKATVLDEAGVADPDADGLLWHRCDAHRRGGHRAESR